MATTEKKGGSKPKSGGKSRKDEAPKVAVEHAGKDLPVPAPRLKAYYEKTVKEHLRTQFGFTNVHEIPNLEKIVINCGMGEAIKNP